MPTADRRDFVPRAIRQFLRQDYPPAATELLVIDDGLDRVADLIPPDPRIRYLALDEKRSIGAKRNLACAEARGEIILHWDDDDWMAERRIRVQVEALSGAGAEVSGLPRLYFHQPDTGESWEYACPRRDRIWLAGATLCYTKELWRENPFPDTSVGEDTQFLWTDRPKRLAPLDDPSLYVATLHPGNTSSKRTAVPGWHPAPGDVVLRLLGEAVPVEKAIDAPRIIPIAAPSSPLPALSTAPTVPGRVSCIMPTRADRRRFLPQAVRCFLRQDYPDRELVIVDDGGDSAASLLPADPRIVYLHLQGDHSAGHKRNLAVERSQGEIIVHWDDDDGSAEDRLRHQVEILLERRAEVCGFADETVLDLNDREGGAFWRCSPALHARMFFADVHGRSIAYRRELWGPHRYPDRSLGEDAAFLAAVLQAGARLTRVSGAERFLYVRHADNAWSFRCGEFLDRAGWERVEAPGFLAPSDREFYRLAPASPGALGSLVQLSHGQNAARSRA
jgi:glycosyltransferase involved in cell wall biosynthesis